MKKMLKKKQSKTIQTVLITLPTNFPSGIAVKTDTGTYWIKDNKKYKLISERAAESWRFVEVLATDSALSTTKSAGKLGFRDGTLIKNIADGKMYLISQNKRRHILSPDAFDKYGLNRSMLIEVSEAETNMHELGENL
jgi:hypothetical protein